MTLHYLHGLPPTYLLGYRNAVNLSIYRKIVLNTHINVRICDKNRYLCTESVNLAIYYYMQETIKTIKLSQIKVNAENPLTPHGKDGDGNLIYTYSGAQF